METSKNAVIYCRVSTKEQVDEGGSLATQEKICKEYAFKNGYNIVETFIEEGESAKTAKRTELRRLLNYCTIRKNQISAVIAYKIDRIARNIDDYRQIRLALKVKGVEIKSTSEFFEDTPAGRFMENIIANVAQFDNDVRTERSVNGMRDALREGRFTWYAPIGYTNVKIAGKATIAQSGMAPLVLKAFEEVAKNVKPIENVWRDMVREGLVSRAGKPVIRSHFYKMLRNELYAGWVSGLGVRNKGIFEPIVSEALFEQVQRVLKHRKRRSAEYRRDNPDFPLRCFVYHPSGRKLTGCWSKGRSTKYPYYLFHIKGFLFKKDMLEQSFMDFFDQLSLSESQYSNFRSKFRINLFKATEDKRKQYVQSQKYITDLKQKQQTLIQKNLTGVISDVILKEQLHIIEEEMLKHGSIIDSEPVSKSKLEDAFNMVADYLKKPSAIWNIAPLHIKLKLQWFNFPKGVCFDGKEFRTSQIACVFKDENGILLSKSSWVTPRFSSLNQIPNKPYAVTNAIDETGKSANSKANNKTTHWSAVEQEVLDLADIIREITSRD